MIKYSSTCIAFQYNFNGTVVLLSAILCISLCLYLWEEGVPGVQGPRSRLYPGAGLEPLDLDITESLQRLSKSQRINGR